MTLLPEKVNTYAVSRAVEKALEDFVGKPLTPEIVTRIQERIVAVGAILPQLLVKPLGESGNG